MSECLEINDFQVLGESFLNEFDRRVASLPQDLCAPFHREARQLETELFSLYRTVALCAKKQESLETVSQLWGSMVGTCDASVKRLGELVKQHPYCGAEIYSDTMLDLRNKCYRLQTMHS